jgi:hypothetical protein
MIILPSLEIVPAKYNTSTNTLLSQIPIDGTGDFTVSRTTSPVTGQSTRVNALGQIELVADNVPRLDYPIGGGCPALLVEPSAQNVIVQSQNWLASGWRSDATANVTTVSSTTGTLDPSGTYTANAISPTSGSATHLKVGNDGSSSFTSGTIYTQSGFFKQGTGNAGRYIQLTYPAARFIQEGYANFDLQLGTVAVVSGTSADTNRAASIENYGNGWYRCRFTATCNNTGTGNGFSAILITASGDTRAPSFAGTTTDVLYGWGAQTETGSVATSYIPTTTQATTRGAEVIRKTGITSLLGQSEGTVYFEVEVTDEARNKWFCSIDSVAGSFIQMYITPTRTIAVQIQNSSSVVMAQLTSSALTVGYHKIAFAYNTATNGCIMYIDGVQNPVATRTVVAPGLPAFSNMSFGTYFSTTSDTLKAHVRAGAVYPNRLTNAELAFITQP